MKDLYTDLLEVVQPYLSDFTGYDEKEQAFNIVLAVKELLSEFSIENERLKEELATYGATGVCEVCSDKANKLADKYLGCLQEIKAIAEKLMADNLCDNCDGIGLDANCQDTGCPYYQMDKILQKITKAEEE